MSKFNMLILTDSLTHADHIAAMLNSDNISGETAAPQPCTCTYKSLRAHVDLRCQRLNGMLASEFESVTIAQAKQTAALSGREESVWQDFLLSPLISIQDQFEAARRDMPHVFAEVDCQHCLGTGVAKVKYNLAGQYASAKPVLDSSAFNMKQCSAEFAQTVAVVVVHSCRGVDVHLSRPSFKNIEHWREEIAFLCDSAIRLNKHREVRCFVYDCHS